MIEGFFVVFVVFVTFVVFVIFVAFVIFVVLGVIVLVGVVVLAGVFARRHGRGNSATPSRCHVRIHGRRDWHGMVMNGSV